MLDGFDSTKFYRQVGDATDTAGPGWVTVAKNQSSRKHAEVIVSDGESSDHSFIRIDWMRSYADSNFSVINVGGHANRIQGVRVLSQDSDNTYGWKYLQVYVTTSSSYGVRINSLGTIHGYTSHTAVSPTLQNTISGYSIHGNALTNLQDASLAAEEGITAGGNILANNFSGSSSGTNTGDQDLSGYSTASGVEDNADVTDTANVVSALTAGTNVQIASNGTISSTNTTYSVGDNGLTAKNFTSTLKTKLDGIEAGADVTDAIAVSAAGAMLKAGAEKSTAMKEFETTLTNQDDWVNSPISIGERGNVTSTESADKYAPNLNFHWGGRNSNSLWMSYDGILHYGGYGSTGVPATDGTFKAATLYAGSEDITATKVGNWNTAYGWGDHGLSAQDKTDIGNLSGTNTGDQTLPTLSSLGAAASSHNHDGRYLRTHTRYSDDLDTYHQVFIYGMLVRLMMSQLALVMDYLQSSIGIQQIGQQHLFKISITERYI